MKKYYKHALLISGILIVTGLFQVGKMLLKPSSPEQVAQKFIEVLNEPTKYENLDGVVSASDYQVIKANKEGFISLLPFKKNGKSIEITKISPLSASVQKVDFIAGDKGYTINITKNSKDSWSINLELAKEQKKRLLYSDLQDAQAENNSEKSLKIYEELAKVDSSQDYQEVIASLRKEIELKQAQVNYPEKIEISSIKVDGKLITAQVNNLGNQSVSKLTGRIDIFNPKDELIFTQEAVLFEVIPGSFVYGQKIQGQFSKKIGIELAETIDKKNRVQLSVTSVEF